MCIHEKTRRETNYYSFLCRRFLYIFVNYKIENLKKEIAKVFKIKDLGEIKECLGMSAEIARKRSLHWLKKIIRKMF